MTEEKMKKADVQKMVLSALETWKEIDRVEVVLKGSEFEGLITCVQKPMSKRYA